MAAGSIAALDITMSASLCSISESTKAIPSAPAPTTR